MNDPFVPIREPWWYPDLKLWREYCALPVDDTPQAGGWADGPNGAGELLDWKSLPPTEKQLYSLQRSADRERRQFVVPHTRGEASRRISAEMRARNVDPDEHATPPTPDRDWGWL